MTETQRLYEELEQAEDKLFDAFDAWAESSLAFWFEVVGYQLYQPQLW